MNAPIAKAIVQLRSPAGKVVLILYPATTKKEISRLLELASAALREAREVYGLTGKGGQYDTP